MTSRAFHEIRLGYIEDVLRGVAVDLTTTTLRIN